MNSRSNRPLIRDTVQLSGWLFADLLLGLMIIILVSLPSSNKSVAQTVSTPTLAQVQMKSTEEISSSVLGTATTSVEVPLMKNTSTPVPTPTLLPTVEIGLSQIPVEITIKTNADTLLGYEGSTKQNEIQRLKNDLVGILTQKGVLGHRAGLVFTSGVVPSSDQFMQGQNVATAVNNILTETLPNVFSGAIIRSFHFINASPERAGDVELEIYLFTANQ